MANKTKEEKYEEKLLEYTKKLGEIILVLFSEEESINILANTLANMCIFSDDPKKMFFDIAKKFFLLSKTYNQDREKENE